MNLNDDFQMTRMVYPMIDLAGYHSVLIITGVHGMTVETISLIIERVTAKGIQL